MADVTSGGSDRARVQAIKSDLTHRLVTLRGELEKRKRREMKIGILGARSSCKSSLLTAWYMFGREDTSSDSCRLVAPWYRNDEHIKIHLDPYERTIEKLDAVKDDILEHGTAIATGMIAPDVIEFTMHVNAVEVELKTLDFTGSFLQAMAANDEFKEPAEKAREFIRECDVVLCLVDACQDAFLTLNALSLCFKQCQQMGKQPSFVLGITKFDSRWPIPQSKAQEQATLGECETMNPSLASIRSCIEEVYAEHMDRVATMLLAPLGRDFAGENLPEGVVRPLCRNDLMPFNICAPLLQAFRFRCMAIEKLEVEIAGIERQIANADAHNDRLRELERVKLCNEHRARLDKIVSLDTNGEDVASIEAELNEIEAEAKKLVDNNLAEYAHKVKEERRSQFKQKQRFQLKERFVTINREIDTTGTTSVRGLARLDSWIRELREIQEESKKLPDPDLEANCKTLIRKLGMLLPVVKGAQMAATRTAEVLPVLGIVVASLVCVVVVVVLLAVYLAR